MDDYLKNKLSAINKNAAAPLFQIWEKKVPILNKSTVHLSNSFYSHLQRTERTKTIGPITVVPKAPRSIMPKRMTSIEFLDIDSLELARQIAIMDMKLYAAIKPWECIGRKNKKKKSDFIFIITIP
jgi:hypothetical protein